LSRMKIGKFGGGDGSGASALGRGEEKSKKPGESVPMGGRTSLPAHIVKENKFRPRKKGQAERGKNKCRYACGKQAE